MRRHRMITDRQAALGIGAMLVFIAMILLAVISGAVIIRVAEVISQPAELTSAQVNPDISRKIIVNNIWIGDIIDDYLIMFTFHPAGSAVYPTDVHVQLYCTTSAGVFMYFSTPLVAAVGSNNGGANPGPYGYGGLDVWEITANPASGNAATLEPGKSYFVRLDGDNNFPMTSDCDPQYLKDNGIAGNLWFHIEGGQSTHEVFYVYDRTHGTQIL